MLRRHKVLDPYRPAFDPNHVASSFDKEMIPHRYLFDCYLYQYHLLQFAVILINMVRILTDTLAHINNIAYHDIHTPATLLRLARRDRPLREI
jgi:hypothetical protein